MDFKQLVLGANYARLRASRSAAAHRYSLVYKSLQKSYLDTMRHKTRNMFESFTIPIVLHRNDAVNKNLNLRKLTKIFMKDMLTPADGKFKFKFYLNERYADKKSASGRLEDSVKVLLNQISDRAAKTGTTTSDNNRSSELRLYVSSAVDNRVTLVGPSQHKKLMAALKKSLVAPYKLTTKTRQYYARLGESHCSLSTRLIEPLEFFITKWTQVGTNKAIEVNLQFLELTDEITHVGISKSHQNYQSLMQSKLLNPITGVEVKVVELDEDVIGITDTSIMGLLPNHIESHRVFFEGRGLKFQSKNYDFHSAPYLSKRERFASALNVEKTTDPLIPVIFSPTVIENSRTKDSFEITKFSVHGYLNILEEFMGPVLELLLSIRDENFNLFKNRLHKDNSTIVTENAWLCLMVLKALGLDKSYKVINVPAVIDFQERDISKMRPDLNKIYDGIPIDHLAELYFRQTSIPPADALPVDPNDAISTDMVRGILLNPSQSEDHSSTMFDESHKTIELLKLSLLLELFNNYSIKFLGKNNKLVALDAGFENVFWEKTQQIVSEWNLYMIHKFLVDTTRFEKAKKDGDIPQMQAIFGELLTLVSNGHWDLLNSEIMIAAKNPRDLPHSKLYLKKIMGTMVYYLHFMADNFYPNEASYVLKKLPLLDKKFDLTKDLAKFEEYQAVIDTNTGERSQVNFRISNFSRLFDTDIIRDGSMFVHTAAKLKETLMLKYKSEDKFGIILEIKDSYNFIKFKEYERNFNLVYNIFKPEGVFTNNSIKMVTEMSHKFVIKIQKSTLPDGLESYGVPNAPGTFIHLVKADSMYMSQPEHEHADDAEVSRSEEGQNHSNDKLTFQDLMTGDDSQKIVSNDSELDKVYEEILTKENERQEERERSALEEQNMPR